MFWENFLRLCNGKEISPNALAVALKIPSGSITNWKNGMVPRQATLLRIADYFGVTVDYLLGKEAPPPAAPDTIQQAYDRAPEEIKAAVRKLLDI